MVDMNSINEWFTQQYVNLAIDGLNDGPAKMPPGFEKVATLMQWGKWVGLVVCILCLVGFFAHLASERQNGGGSGSMGWLGKILIGVIGISAVFSLVGFLV
jgi:hypothetical protein